MTQAGWGWCRAGCRHLVPHGLSPDGVLSGQCGAAQQDEEQDEVGEPGGVDDAMAQDADPAGAGEGRDAVTGLRRWTSPSRSVEKDSREPGGLWLASQGPVPLSVPAAPVPSRTSPPPTLHPIPQQPH